MQVKRQNAKGKSQNRRPYNESEGQGRVQKPSMTICKGRYSVFFGFDFCLLRFAF